LGAFYAVLGILLINKSYIMLILSVPFLIIMTAIVTNGVGLYRKLKYMFAFLFFQVVIGGLVYYGYCTLDKILKNSDLTAVGSENRNLLILSLIVLLSIGVLKVALSVFGRVRSEKNISLHIEYAGKINEIDALVDSGNLALDPWDRTPVMLITRKMGEKIFGIDLSDPENFDSESEIKKKIRVIPISVGKNKKIFYGLKPDNAYVVSKNKSEKISIVIAVDDEREEFGGYFALMPLAALEDIFV
jgi:sigma-E processing peptidase SpoIIGA